MSNPTRCSEVFGLEELRHRCLDNMELVSKVLDAFLASFTQSLDELKEFVEQRECAVVRKIAHKMKGAAGNAAAYRLHQLAGRVEQAAEAEQIEACARELADLRAEWDSFLSTTSDLTAQRACDHLPRIAATRY